MGDVVMVPLASSVISAPSLATDADQPVPDGIVGKDEAGDEILMFAVGASLNFNRTTL